RRLVANASGHRGSLTGLLDVPAEWAAAVDAALGPWADASVFGGKDALEAAVSALKSNGRGGVPIVAAGGDATTDTARRAADEAGAEAMVDRLGPRCDRGLAKALLGDVVVVEGWGAASRIVALHPEVRVVTPEGDLITRHGVRVAHPDGATPAMLEAAEIAEERAETELARVQSLHTSSKREFDDARQVERRTLEELEAHEAQMSGVSEA